MLPRGAHPGRSAAGRPRCAAQGAFRPRHAAKRTWSSGKESVSVSVHLWLKGCWEDVVRGWERIGRCFGLTSNDGMFMGTDGGKIGHKGNSILFIINFDLLQQMLAGNCFNLLNLSLCNGKQIVSIKRLVSKFFNDFQ